MNKKPKSNKSTGRDYSYDKEYQKSPTQVANRVKRNQARAEMIKEGRAKVGDGKDVDHKKPLKNGGSNHKSNLRVISKSANRSKK
ncbi:MAG: HNH endonuclease [Chlorobi bacterium]|nr:HNH endonuclease [Chlorobiota bacterium]